jgi:ribosome modulation factor
MSAAEFTLDSEAWNAGFAAGEAGKPLTACPYPARSPESLAWHSGFIEGKAKRRSA